MKPEVYLKYDIMLNGRYLFAFLYKHDVRKQLRLENVKRAIEERYTFLKGKPYKYLICN